MEKTYRMDRSSSGQNLNFERFDRNFEMERNFEKNLERGNLEKMERGISERQNFEKIVERGNSERGNFDRENLDRENFDRENLDRGNLDRQNLNRYNSAPNVPPPPPPKAHTPSADHEVETLLDRIHRAQSNLKPAELSPKRPESTPIYTRSSARSFSETPSSTGWSGRNYSRGGISPRGTNLPLPTIESNRNRSTTPNSITSEPPYYSQKKPAPPPPPRSSSRGPTLSKYSEEDIQHMKQQLMTNSDMYLKPTQGGRNDFGDRHEGQNREYGSRNHDFGGRDQDFGGRHQNGARNLTSGDRHQNHQNREYGGRNRDFGDRLQTQNLDFGDRHRREYGPRPQNGGRELSHTPTPSVRTDATGEDIDYRFLKSASSSESINSQDGNFPRVPPPPPTRAIFRHQ